jgi:hypothetical protein
MTNCIVWGNKADKYQEIFVSSTSSPTVAFSALSGDWEGEGNIMVEDSPFATNDDYHLKEDSSCIDKGTDKITLPEFDFEGDPRVLGSAPDMGADESGCLARIAIKLDIKPGGNPNRINLKSKGVVPVAILTDGSFYVYAIDIRSVKFAGARWIRWTMEDVDNDGDEDMLFHFRTKDLALTEGSTEATLCGVMFDGKEIHGTDKISIVPCSKDKGKRRWKKHRRRFGP